MDEDRLAWWEIFVNVRRALTCVDYGRRHLKGTDPSIDLALITHSVAELELETLSLIDRQDRIVREGDGEEGVGKIARKAAQKAEMNAVKEAGKKAKDDKAKENKNDKSGEVKRA